MGSSNRDESATLNSVNTLIPFDSSALQKFEISADVIFDSTDKSSMTVKFLVQDPLKEVDLENRLLMFEGGFLERKNDLWKNTCFEMFLNPVGQKQYYEFNFNLQGEWNVYHFAGYRFPQPPAETVEFSIESLMWKDHELTVKLRHQTAFQNFNVGLTAVIKNKKNLITYYALKHEGGKPDFHQHSGFTLTRG